MRIFLDASVVLAACGRPAGGSRAIFDFAPRNGWRLLTSRYVLNEVAKNLTKLPPAALTVWPTLLPRLTVTRDVWTMACTDNNREDQLVQKTFAGHLRDRLPPRLMSGAMAV